MRPARQRWLTPSPGMPHGGAGTLQFMPLLPTSILASAREARCCASSARLKTSMSKPELRSGMLLRQLREMPRPSWSFFALLSLLVGSGLALYHGLDEVPAQYLAIVFVVSGWITSLCLHEFGHAFAAYLGGDTRVKEAGYLSLDPLKYTHPVYSLGLPLLYLFMGGVGLPGGAVYINVGALRNRWWQSLTAAAGPLGTIVFHLAITWPFITDQIAISTGEHIVFWSALAYLALIEITALIFNLLPIPGLDGFGLIAPWLPPPLKRRAVRLGSLPFLLLAFGMWSFPPVARAFWDGVYSVAAAWHVPLGLARMGEQWFRLF